MKKITRGVNFILVLAAAVLTIFGAPLICRAGTFSGDWSFSEDKEWTLLFEDTLNTHDGNVQSICVTDNYIITIENTSNSYQYPDTVTAYWRYDHDENGNPVQQYSRARRVMDTDWEHGNGMTYVPGRNLIYVPLYSSLDSGNRGNLWVMDPESLSHVDTVHLSDSWNALGIQYMPETDTFLILTNAEGSYSLLEYNSDFSEIVRNYGSMNADDGAANFQDFYASGSYVLLLPLGVHDYTSLHVFNTADQSFISDERCNFDNFGAGFTEPEGLSLLDPGRLIMTVTEKYADGRGYVRVYAADFSWVCGVTAESDGGNIGVTARDPEGNIILNASRVPLHSTLTLSFEPYDGNVLSGLYINGTGVGIAENDSEYEFGSVTDDLDIKADFSLPEGEMNASSASAGGTGSNQSRAAASAGDPGSGGASGSSAAAKGSGADGSSSGSGRADGSSAAAKGSGADGSSSGSGDADDPSVTVSGNVAAAVRAARGGISSAGKHFIRLFGSVGSALSRQKPMQAAALLILYAGIFIFIMFIVRLNIIRARKRRIMKMRREEDRRYIEQELSEKPEIDVPIQISGEEKK